jgi:flagellar hook-basal body complex protein FliE
MINSIVPGAGLYINGNVNSVPPANSGQAISSKFGDLLDSAINRIVDDEKQVHQLNDAFASGQMENVEQLLITSEKALLNLELTVQIRNKVIEAYQEIMRTQI